MQGDKPVTMVRHSASSEQDPSVIAEDSRNVAVKRLSDLFGDHWDTIPSAEDQMIIQGGE
jgi:hypothetical protein